MNAHQKLSNARVKLQKSEIKKSGKNKHLGFEYFELADFLPTINEINAESGLLTAFSISEEMATLTVFNAEKPEEMIIFTSPVAHAKLQGNASPIQELGSQHTYMRRYLYLMAYEIIENDSLDAQVSPQVQNNPNTTNTSNNGKKLSDGQIKRLYAISNSKGRTVEQVNAAIKSHYKVEHVADLNKKQYDEIVSKYESMPNAESETK